jgi:hypothetical protein
VIQRKFALDQDNQILHDKDEDDIEPGPRSNAGATTMSDAGLTGGGVLSRGKSTTDPTGTFSQSTQVQGVTDPMERGEEQDVEREEGMQNVLIHTGAAPDAGYDGNEHADEKVEIVQPDGSPLPRAG